MKGTRPLSASLASTLAKLIVLGFAATFDASGAGTAANALQGTAGFNVNAPASFTVGGTAVSIPPGANTGNTSIITVAPTGGFTGSVALTASLTTSPAGAHYPPTFNFDSTGPVNITNATAATARLKISSTASTSTALAYPLRRGVHWYTVGGSALACVLFFGVPVRRRRRRIMLCLLFFLAMLTGGMVACGGTPSTLSIAENPGTTAGAYTVTVTATSGALTETGAFALTVK